MSEQSENGVSDRRSAFGRVIDFIVLPSEISPFESDYLARVNRITVQFFLLHIPAFALLAWANGTEPLLALVLTTAVAMGPVVAFRGLKNPRTVGIVYGFTAMLMGGLLVHFGQGPVQIEMHFYFFALLAMLALYGNPMAIITAAVTVAVHHLLLWLVLPASVFNYDAPWWVVGVHAAFVVLESIATVYIARSFFDNVIGLEKVVQARTAELDRRNAAMRLVLDNVDQGLVTLGADGCMQAEHSATLDEWFGTPQAQQPFAEFIAQFDEDFAVSFEMAWEQIVDGILPLEMCLSQAPSVLKHEGRTFKVSYRSLSEEGEFEGALLVIADITAELERERLEAEQLETAAMLERAISDRSGFVEFSEEAAELVDVICADEPPPEHVQRRALHTLKGNCMIYGMQTVADICHELESFMIRESSGLNASQRQELREGWGRLQERLQKLLGDSDGRRYEIDEEQHTQLLEAVLAGRRHSEIARMVADLKLEPTSARLRRVAAQAQRIARRLNKTELQVEIDDSMLRLEPERWASFWSSFIHVVRNAVDHGIEGQDQRVEAGKPGGGLLSLKTEVDQGDFVIIAEDDGRGVSWDQVRAKAQARGIPSETQADLVSALFVEGLSTADEVTEYSGRGVGLSAVYASCKERGGDVQVQAIPGKGTRFSFRFPLEAMAPSPREMLNKSNIQQSKVA